MKKKKSKDIYQKYCFGYVILFIVISVGTTLWQVGVGDLSSGPSRSLAAVSSLTTVAPSSGCTMLLDRLSSSSPVSHNVSISSKTITPDVVLGVYSLSSSGQNANVTKVSFRINGNINAFQNFRLFDGGVAYSPKSIAGNNMAFNPTNISVTKDSWKDLILKADVKATSTSSVVSATILGQKFIGIDSNNLPLNLSSATDATSSSLTLVPLSNQVSISGISAKSSLVNNGSNPATMATVSFSFNLENKGNDTIYISSDPSVMSTFSTTAVSGNLNSLTSPLVVNPAGFYVIQPGSSASLTLGGSLNNAGGSSGVKELKITKIYYGNSSTGLQKYNISSGLENLRVFNYLNK